MGLVLRQRYQEIDGHLEIGGLEAGLRDATLDGDQIRFAWVDDDGVRHELSGRVSGAEMQGTLRSGAGLDEGHWTASRR
jgi:hypothetical protein